MKKSTIFLALLAASVVLPSQAQRSAKRGFGDNKMSYRDDLTALARGCSWWYNWAATPPASYSELTGADKLIEFDPMAWNGNYDINALRAYYQAHPQDKYLLGFNEPNFKAQSNMTPTQAAQKWPDLEKLANELGLKLVAPALNYPDGAINDGKTYQPTEWMDAFISEYKRLYNKEPKIDYLALHCYMDDPAAMQGFVDNFAQRYGKQVWLTEFCAWEQKSVNSAKEQESTMIQKLQILEKDPNVFRYAWFQAHGNAGVPYNSLFNNNGKAGSLTDLGFSYVNMSAFNSTYYYKVGERIPANQFVDVSGLDSLSRGYDTRSDSVDVAFLRGMTSTYQVDVPTAGDYTLLVRAAVENGTRTTMMPRFDIIDGDGNKLASRQAIAGTDNDSTYSATQIKVTLKAGKQKITLSKVNASTAYVSSLKLVSAVDPNDSDTKTVTVHRLTAEELNPVQPSGPDDVNTEYGYWGSAALDDKGETTFDFANSTDAVLIGTSTGVTNAFTGKTTANYNVDGQKNFLYIWDANGTLTYNAESSQGVNSFGFQEDYSHFTVGTSGWSGLGYASQGTGKDLSMINDDYIFHIGFRGISTDGHASHEVTVGNAKFTIGSTSFENTPVLGDYKRDGSWTYFDIPVTVLKYIAGGDLFDNPSSYEGNVVSILSGGTAGTDLEFDNIFFYKNPNVKKGLPTGDTKTQIGKYATKSVVDGTTTFNFDNVAKAVLIGTSQGVTQALSAVTAANYNVDDQKNFFYLWDGGDYTAGSSTATANSFGYEESSTALVVSGTSTWDGAGYSSSAGNGKDLSMIGDDWYLHFAMRGTDNITHPSQTVTVGNAKFVIGNATLGDQILGDYKRDGEWYSYDIPVSKLKQLAGKDLFDNVNSFEGNVFAVVTTHMKGAEVNFDNVFFYQKKDNSDAPVEPTYVTKALDSDGKFTFNFDKSGDAVLISTASGVAEAFYGKVKADYRVDDTNNFLYIWENTMTPSTEQGVNSFGWNEGGNTVYTVGNAGWSGIGFASANVGKDLSMLNDDYILHFGMKGTDNTTYLLTVGNAKVAIGSTGYKDGDKTIAPLCDFPRDGEWYYFDIPFSEFSSRATNVFDNPGNYMGNVFALLAGGTAGAKLEFDNVFFYKDITATGINSIQNSESTIQNSKREGIYDLMGRKLEKITRPGVYIVNGRKVVKR